MSEYGPDFFRNYLDSLDRLDERKLSYKDLLNQFGTDVGKTLCPPGTKSAKCGSGNFDPENYRPEEEPPSTLPGAGTGLQDYMHSQGIDPCPSRSQTWDPKTKRCVDWRGPGAIRDMIDRMQNDPMLQPQLKEQGDEKEQAKQELKEIMGQLEDLGQEAAGIMQQHFPQIYRSGEAYGAFEFGWSRNQYDTTFASLLKDLDEEDPDGMYEE